MSSTGSNLYDRLESARAFNRGSDARLAGRPLSANPYPATPEDGRQWQNWRYGWQHADASWGLDAKWPVKELPNGRG